MVTDSISLTSQLLLPFMTTAGASLTVLAIQALNQYRKEHLQRIYVIGYMADVLLRITESELIIQKHTVGPHIEAIKRILSGDWELLELALEADEFDILTTGPMSFTQLPESHKLLVGYDDIKIIQAFDALFYFNSEDGSRLALRTFVAENLKSKMKFLELGIEHQNDILNTYWDYLRRLEHEGKRLAAFNIHIFSPMLRAYAGSKKFKFFNTKTILQTLDCIASLQAEYQEFVPSKEFIKQSIDGGIQGVL